MHTRASLSADRLACSLCVRSDRRDKVKRAFSFKRKQKSGKSGGSSSSSSSTGAAAAASAAAPSAVSVWATSSYQPPPTTQPPSYAPQAPAMAPEEARRAAGYGNLCGTNYYEQQQALPPMPGLDMPEANEDLSEMMRARDSTLRDSRSEFSSGSNASSNNSSTGFQRSPTGGAASGGGSGYASPVSPSPSPSIVRRSFSWGKKSGNKASVAKA